jgi:hypothetical protein
LTYIIRAHDGSIDEKAFNCGQFALDDYIRRYALQDVGRSRYRGEKPRHRLIY